MATNRTTINTHRQAGHPALKVGYEPRMHKAVGRLRRHYRPGSKWQVGAHVGHLRLA